MEENGIKINERMGHMENNTGERIVNLIQNSEEKRPKGDDVSHGAQ